MTTTSRPAVSGVLEHGEYLKTDRLLVWAVTFFAIAVLIHNSDHARRGVDSIGRDVYAVGSFAVILEVGIAVLVYQRHRLAPLAAAVTGFSLGAGYLFVHFLPQRSWLSDSFTSATNVSPMSWVAASLETIAALTLGVVGLIVLRRRGGLASAELPNPSQRTLREAVSHPIVVLMIVGNAVILAISLAQL